MNVASEPNGKHLLFAKGILAGKNQTQAYIDAGYSVNGARGHASRLVAKGNIKDYLRVKKLEQVEKAQANAKHCEIEWLQCQLRLLKMALGDELVSKSFLVNKQLNSVKVYETNLSAANRAQELVGKRYGWLAKNIDSQQKTIEFNFTNSSIFRSKA